MFQFGKWSAVLRIILWKEGFWVLSEKLGFISKLAVYAVVIIVSGLSAVTYWLVVSEKDDLVGPKPPSQVIGISAGISISCLSGFSFRSEIYFRVDRYTSTLPRARPRNHGGGRSCTRTGHNGRRISFPGLWDETQLARQITATYVPYGRNRIQCQLPANSPNVYSLT